MPSPLKLQVADAQTTVLSVSKVCDGGHEVPERRRVDLACGDQQKDWRVPVSIWSLQDGSRSRRRCNSGFQRARVTSGTFGSSVGPDHELEEEAEELALVEEGAQEEGEGEGNDLFGESQNDENDVEINGEMVFDEEEALLPAVVRDPGASTEKEIAEYSATHLPRRSWCPTRVQGRARDRPHRRVHRSEHALPELHFDHAFLGTRDEAETQAIQVMRDTKTGMMFAHHVRMRTARGKSSRMWKSSGYDKIILRSDGEAALKSIQAEVARIRERETVLENSPVGDSKASGVPERALRASGEQFRVIREGL